MLSNLGRVSFFSLSLLVAVMSLRFLIAPMELVMDHMIHYRPDVPIAMYAHILGAPIALALAPFQLWRRLRDRRPAVHRAMGYGYALAVLVAGVGSFVMLPYFNGTLWSAVGFAVLGGLWVGFTGRGVWLARAGNHTAHRRWMIRSVALTFGAVMLRVYMTPLMASGWSVPETYQITAWASWVPNLIVVEWWFRRGRV